ncbi:MAG: carboxypeptidase-like regulatory domain-containing protein, partial [Flavobacteriaceae bacterium]|nr:carboxypeptidase-like regulatory domain-containing protein [Flavobacteriaceae bacterium]
MKFKYLLFSLLCVLSVFSAVAQVSMLKGNVVDNVTKVPLAGVELVIEGTSFKAITDENGNFDFGSQELPEGDQVLLLSRELYLDSKFDIVLTKGQTLELKGLFLSYDTQTESLSTGVISLTENDLGDDENAANNLGGLLQASRDVFYRAAAFDFSATFFRPRGYNSENGKVLINGLEMNKLFDGRPQWSNWGGLNDMQRNQTFAVGLAPVDNNFGGVAGTQSIDMRASSYRKGGRISYAAANRSYVGRVMATYSSGLMSNGWAYSISGSRRFAEEGFVDGTLYDANSIGLSVERKINEEHSINFTGMYTPNRRGRRTSITNEERALKSIRYNPFWGYQNGDIRNSRNREIEEPIFMLNHYWTLSPKTTLNTNVGYQFGKIGNTRIDNGGTDLVQIDGQNAFLGGARNPSPNYWQLLPSFFLQSTTPSAQDFQNAFLAAERFRNDGQFDWNRMYEANRIQAEQGKNSVYILQEDRIDDQQLTANIILNTQINDNILFDAGVNYRNLNSENFARVNDLLGGTGFLDVDFFSDEVAQENTSINDIGQSDVRNPNRIVREGDRYKYNYEIDAEVYGAFAQAQFRYSKIDFYTAANISRTTYQRTGIFENGNFQGSRSFGKGEEVDFTDYGVKGGFTYKVTGRHLIDVNAGFITQAPFIRNVFSNARQNHDIVDGIDSEEITTVDASYIFRGTKLKAKVTGFYSEFANGTNVGFYFTEDLTGLPL